MKTNNKINEKQKERIRLTLEPRVSTKTLQVALAAGFRNIRVKRTDNHFNKLILPTQVAVQTWLREVHNIHVYCIPEVISGIIEDNSMNYYYNIVAKKRAQFSTIARNGEYSEVLEKGLEVALKLIKRKII